MKSYWPLWVLLFVAGITFVLNLSQALVFFTPVLKN